MHKLTATAVSNAKPGTKNHNLSDGGGLYLLVKPNGTKAWRFNYRFTGKQKTLAIGVSRVIHKFSKPFHTNTLSG